MTEDRTVRPRLSPVTVAGLSIISIAFAALSSACAPDSSVGEDSVPGQAGSTGASAGAVPGGQSGVAGASAAGSTGVSGSTSPGGGGDDSVAGSGTAGSVNLGGSGGAQTGAAGAAGGGIAGSGGGGKMGPGGPSLCPVAGATLCDGFEDVAPGATGSAWTAVASTVDTTKFYRGAKSIHFTGFNAFITETKTFAGTTKATNNAMWGRYFILTSLTAAPDGGHTVFGRLTDGKTDFHFVGGSRGELQAEIRTTGDIYTDKQVPTTIKPAYPTAADGWQCWEWHTTGDDSFDFYIGGVLVPEMQIVKGKATKSGNAFPFPVFNKLQLGYQNFNSAALSGWIDEVAIGPNQIGCGF
jgi:hypothetical protein